MNFRKSPQIVLINQFENYEMLRPEALCIFSGDLPLSEASLSEFYSQWKMLSLFSLADE